MRERSGGFQDRMISIKPGNLDQQAVYHAHAGPLRGHMMPAGLDELDVLGIRGIGFESRRDHGSPPTDHMIAKEVLIRLFERVLADQQLPQQQAHGIHIDSGGIAGAVQDFGGCPGGIEIDFAHPERPTGRHQKRQSEIPHFCEGLLPNVFIIESEIEERSRQKDVGGLEIAMDDGGIDAVHVDHPATHIEGQLET